MTDVAYRPISDLTVNLDRKRVPVKSTDRRPGPYPYYGASGIVDYVDGFLFEGLHLLVAEDGENLRSRSTPVAFLAEGRFWVNNHAHVLQGNHENDTRYLSYALEATDISGYITGSAQPKFIQSALASIRVPAPPLPMQRAIAATLGALDDKIESNLRAIAVSEELARAHFSRLFDLSQVESGVPLSELLAVNPRRILPARTPATYVGMSSLPEFSAEVHEWERREAGSGQRFQNGDVLMARITPCLENGKTAVVDMLSPGEVGWGSTEYVVLAPSRHLSTAWIYCLVRDESVRAFAIRSMSGTSGRQRFHADRFSQYKISPPAVEALESFNILTEPLFRRMTQLRDENKRLAALRDTLLPELLSGRLRVSEAQDMAVA